MNQNTLSILLVGNTNNYPLLLAEAFRAMGHDVQLIVTRKELLHRPESKYPAWKEAYPEWIEDYSHLSDDDLLFRTPSVETLLSKLSIRFDLAVLNDVGPALAQYLKGPHISLLTGSDLTYYADYSSVAKRSKLWAADYKRSRKGRETLYGLAAFVAAQRDGIASSELVCFGQRGLIPEGDCILDDLGIGDAQRMMLYLSDTVRLSPVPSRPSDKLRILCGSRVVFRPPQDPAFGAIDSKGTDKLIEGYARYCRQGGQGELRLVRKGPDVEAAVQLIQRLGIQDRVVWLAEMPLSDFYQEMEKADLVCDQMGTSFPGMVTMDAYALGKPVMADFRNEVMIRAFPEPLPGLSVRSSEEVAQMLLRIEKDAFSLSSLGQKSRRYAEEHLSPLAMAEKILDRVLTQTENANDKISLTFQRALQLQAPAADRAGRSPILSGPLCWITEEDIQTLWNNPKLLRLFVAVVRFAETIPGLSKMRSLFNEVRKKGALAGLRYLKKALIRFIHKQRMRLAGLGCMNVPFDKQWPESDRFLFPHTFSGAALTGKPSVCLVTVNLSAGGAERQVAGLAVELKKRGFSVCVRVLRLYGENGHYFDFLKHHNVDVKVPAFPNRRDIQFMKDLGVDFALLRHLPEELRTEALALTLDLLRHPVDIVHCYLDWSCCYGGFAALMSGTPLVRFSWRNVNPSHFEFYREWMPELYRFFHQFPGFSYENNTAHGAADYAGWLGMERSEVQTVPNGLCPEMFVTNSSFQQHVECRDRKDFKAGRPDSPLVVSISRLSEEKRPQDLPVILKKLQAQVPSASLFHIGAGHLESELKKNVRREGLFPERFAGSTGGCFKFLGRRSDVFAVLKAADVFLLTSSHEGMPNAVMEAMYAGLPVVASRVGGVPDLVLDGVTGFLHEPGDTEGMSQSLSRLLLDTSLRDQMGAAGRERILSLYTVERLADTLTDVYHSRIQERIKSVSPAGDPKERFAFGQNWAEFVRRCLSDQRKQSSRERLLASLKLASLEGLTFLDIGCGSGLHSLSAFEAGAAAVISFDYDASSVQTTRYLHQRAGSPSNWTILQGSVLDAEFMRRLPKADIVYSWGVLHHTGNVWRAIENAAIPLARNGIFFIALYSYLCYENASIHGAPSPEKWLIIKRQYNQSSPFKKRLMEAGYALTAGFSRPLWNVPAVARSLYSAAREAWGYHQSRGMDYWTDVRDWLGGWPMEFVKEQECLRFCLDRLSLECLQMVTGEGNTEYVFRHQGSKSYWDTAAARRIFSLRGPFESAGGNCWQAYFPEGFAEGGKGGEVILMENECRLSFSKAPRDAIEKLGAGRYAVYSDRVLFSALDNSNPNSNGRRYALAVTVFDETVLPNHPKPARR